MVPRITTTGTPAEADCSCEQTQEVGNNDDTLDDVDDDGDEVEDLNKVVKLNASISSPTGQNNCRTRTPRNKGGSSLRTRTSKG